MAALCQAAKSLTVITFSYRSTRISAKGRIEVTKIGEWLTWNPEKSITVTAYCNDGMSREYALAFCQVRADAVMRELEQSGVPPERITALSMGNEPLYGETHRRRIGRPRAVVIAVAS